MKYIDTHIILIHWLKQIQDSSTMTMNQDGDVIYVLHHTMVDQMILNKDSHIIVYNVHLPITLIAVWIVSVDTFILSIITDYNQLFLIYATPSTMDYGTAMLALDNLVIQLVLSIIIANSKSLFQRPKTFIIVFLDVTLIYAGSVLMVNGNMSYTVMVNIHLYQLIPV